MTLGQRVAVMNEGRLEQVAAPMEVYGRPATRFVGGFVGSPSMNFFPCEVRRDGGAPELAGPFFHLRVEGASAERATLGVRPNDVELVPPGEGDATAVVEVVEPLGSQVLVHLGRPGGGPDGDEEADEAAGEDEIRALVSPERAPGVEEEVGFRFRRDRLHLFDPGTGRRLPREG